MISKHLLQPQRLRHIPPSFSWVDHRLVRHNYLARADHSAWTLYLFLVTVADAQGLSYYSDPAIGRHLKMDAVALGGSRFDPPALELLCHGVVLQPDDVCRVHPGRRDGTVPFLPSPRL